MEVTYDLLLDVGHSGCKQCIELKKSEANTKKLRIELCKGTEPIIIDRESTIAMIRAYKPDGKIIFNSATVTDESKIEYTLGTQDTAVSGTSWYEVQLIADEDGERKVLYSAQFKAVIDDTVVDDGKITSSDEFGKLVDTIADNKQWLTEKNTELNIWMNEQSSLISERESEHNSMINEKESEHIDLINGRTLNEKESFTLTDQDNTTPNKEYKPAYGGSYLTFTSKELQCDLFDVLKIIGGTSTNMIDVYRINDDNTKTQIEVINSGSNFDYRLYDMSGVRKYVIVIREIGAKDADISKFEFVKLSRAVYRNEVVQEMIEDSDNPVSAVAVVNYMKKNVHGMIPMATESIPGVVRLASGSETEAGNDNESAVTPFNLKYILTQAGSFADDEMSENSNGIVKNKVIKAYVDKLIRSIAVDLSDYITTETLNSTIETMLGLPEEIIGISDNATFTNAINELVKTVAKKAKTFTLNGSATPTTKTSDYPEVKIGDLCVNTSYRAWICLYKYENTVVWSEILTNTSPYMQNNYYLKTAVDELLEAKQDKLTAGDNITIEGNLIKAKMYDNTEIKKSIEDNLNSAKVYTDEKVSAMDKPWRLIQDIDVTEELSVLDITVDSDGNPFEVEDIYVEMSNILGKNGSNLAVQIFPNSLRPSTYVGGVLIANPISGTTKRHFFITFTKYKGLNKYKIEAFGKNSGAYNNAYAHIQASSSAAITDDYKVRNVRIHFSIENYITEGNIKVYGR